jgi:hypothetical protein
MRTLFVLTTMVFLTFPLLAIEIGSVPGPEEIKAAQENFINVYQAVTDQAIAFDRLRKHELQKHISDCGAAASTDLAARLRTDTYFRLVTNNGREIPFLVRDNSHYNTIAGLLHLKRQLLACAFAAIDSDTKNQLFLAYQRLSAGIKELDFALQNYYGHLHLKDTP